MLQKKVFSKEVEEGARRARLFWSYQLNKR